MSSIITGAQRSTDPSAFCASGLIGRLPSSRPIILPSCVWVREYNLYWVMGFGRVSIYDRSESTGSHFLHS